MQRAAKLNSVLNQKFWFRRDISKNAEDFSCEEMSLHNILFSEPGPADSQEEEYHRGLGLLKLCKQMFEKKVKEKHCSIDAFNSFMEMYNLFYFRTAGKLPTDAAFLRACLAAHPEYRGNSILSSGATYDICRMAIRMGSGELEVPELLGPFACNQKTGRNNLAGQKTNFNLNDNKYTENGAEAVLHGRGHVAASLQLPDIHARLRAHMLLSPPGMNEDFKIKETVCGSYPSAAQQLALEQRRQRPSAEAVSSE